MKINRERYQLPSAPTDLVGGGAVTVPGEGVGGSYQDSGACVILSKYQL